LIKLNISLGYLYLLKRARKSKNAFLIQKIKKNLNNAPFSTNNQACESFRNHIF